MRLTTRILISKAQIEKIRQKRLDKAIEAGNSTRYLNSKKFVRDINREVRNNRVTRNQKVLDKLAINLSPNASEQQTIRQFFGEDTAVRNDKVVRINRFSTKKQTLRLKKLTQQFKKGTLNLKKYVSRDARFRENRKFLPQNPSNSEIIQALSRDEFYYENQDLIIQYNLLRAKKGAKFAETSKIGQNLQNQYNMYMNEKSDLLKLLWKK